MHFQWQPIFHCTPIKDSRLRFSLLSEFCSQMNKNVSTQPEKVNDKPIYDLEELLAEVYDMIEERRAIEGIYKED